jgi:Terminase large subunit, ATPase domain
MTPKPIREILQGPFAEWLGDDDWRPWSAFLCALRGERISAYEAALYRRCTGRQNLPSTPFREAWVAVGRKGRKSATAAVLAVYCAVYGQWKRAAGETLHVMVIALSKDQARLVLDYAAAILESRPGLARLIEARDTETIRLRNGVEIACFANSYRLVRGPTCVCAILDEVAVWWSDQLSANPDREILRALKPAMITQPGALLIGLSSPYAKRGLLYEKHRDHFGRDDSKILIWQADTATMNPQADKEEIAAAYLDDPLAAAAEFGAQFRDDLQTYVVPDAIEACIDRGVYERSPVPGTTYFSFIDPAGGSGQDAMTLAICHVQGERVVLDCLRERKPPFNPSDVAAEFIDTLKSYRVTIVIGDRFAGEWCRQPFHDAGIFYKLADRTKADLYRDALPIFNSRHVSLLDNRTLVGQLCSLERSTGPTGRDKIEHPRGAHDDLANAAAGALTIALQRPRWETPCETGLPYVGPVSTVQRIDDEFLVHSVTANWRRQNLETQESASLFERTGGLIG